MAVRIYLVTLSGTETSEKENLLRNVHSSLTVNAAKPYMVFVSACNLQMVVKYWQVAVQRAAES